jgi:hypothetical protein
MRGLVVGITAVIGVVMVSGCVTKWKYDEEVEKNEHLMAVKTEQDIERDGLHADVNALHRAYTQQSLRVTAMEGVVTQATAELRTIQSRLTWMNQELTQQRSDVGKLAVQAGEALQILRAVNEQQQASAITLTQLTARLDALKMAANARAAKLAAAAERQPPEGKPSSSAGKSAVERAVEQQMGMGPRVENAASEPGVRMAPPAVASQGTPAGSLNGIGTPASTPSSQGGPPSAGSGVVVGDKPVPPSASAAPGSVSMGPSNEAAKPAASTTKVEDELSPLQRSSLEAKPEPKRKQGWAEWAKEKIWGKKPVQTTATNPPPSESPSYPAGSSRP